MKNHKSSINGLVDAALFVSFIALFFLELTGVALHQWLGIAAGALALYHLIRHWEWVKAVSRRFFGRTAGRARLYYLVDALLLVGLGAILGSGLLISTWFNVSLGSAATAWAAFHVAASQITLLLVVLKVTLHWRWIAKTARGLLSRPTAPVASKPVSASAAIARRDFLKLMGVVVGAAALALVQTTRLATDAGVQAAEPAADADARTAGSTTDAAAQNTSAQSASTAQSASSTAICLARCPKGRSCSYPGSCRDYVDSNRNGHCDRGECA